MNSVCVFLGSNPGKGQDYLDMARALGREIAGRGLTLVYGGSGVGCMRQLADAALESGGRVVGVMPRLLWDKEIGHPGLSRTLLVESIQERKAVMAEVSDAFAALPGGLGTLDEFFEMLTWTQLGLQAKPCGLLDVNGFFGPLKAMLDLAADEGFILPGHRDMILSDKTPAGLLDRLRDFRPPRMGDWIERKRLA
ncbi:MAG: TIGR00730 family Rossman fold protein [Desulfovibrionaceae bacterium]|nr:TIGR00730 family Rossman fold protein [Desulfovibrionaceae bacterium]MDD4951156.1 TIGR00730 family Rossman fold protein [Desulfovibrionaceae bacterium]